MMEPDSSLHTLPGSARGGDGVGGMGWGEGGAAVAARTVLSRGMGGPGIPAFPPPITH